ncbi:hypothetical protein DUHN55_34800 [Helicobacter pylori]
MLDMRSVSFTYVEDDFTEPGGHYGDEPARSRQVPIKSQPRPARPIAPELTPDQAPADSRHVLRKTTTRRQILGKSEPPPGPTTIFTDSRVTR